MYIFVNCIALLIPFLFSFSKVPLHNELKIKNKQAKKRPLVLPHRWLRTVLLRERELVEDVSIEASLVQADDNERYNMQHLLCARAGAVL